MDVIELLMYFNLTRQEATIYITLYKEGEVTGYEVAKKNGISRSNTYASLASLVEKGAAYSIEGNAMRFTAVPIEEFCTNKISVITSYSIHYTKLYDLLLVHLLRENLRLTGTHIGCDTTHCGA